jgi:hypothetical protein
MTGLDCASTQCNATANQLFDRSRHVSINSKQHTQRLLQCRHESGIISQCLYHQCHACMSTSSRRSRRRSAMQFVLAYLLRCQIRHVLLGLVAERKRLTIVAMLCKHQQRTELRCRFPHQTSVVEVQQHIALISSVEEDRSRHCGACRAHSNRRAVLPIQIAHVISRYHHDIQSINQSINQSTNQSTNLTSRCPRQHNRCSTVVGMS